MENQTNDAVKGGAREGAGRKTKDASQKTKSYPASLYAWEYQDIIARHGSLTKAARSLVSPEAIAAQEQKKEGAI